MDADREVSVEETWKLKSIYSEFANAGNVNPYGGGKCGERFGTGQNNHLNSPHPVGAAKATDGRNVTLLKNKTL
jgi:hypothetical protein